ncbi:MAG: ABC transporter permease subunit [Rubrobacteridae bacterium]|nr:ABC transporter permease subunit [Rubrobacteridae bacterium]
MNALVVLIRKDVLEQLRTKKAFIMGFIFLFLAIVSPVSAKMMPLMLKGLSGQNGITINIPEPTFMASIDQFVKNATQLVCFLLIFIVAGSIADEKIRKTLELVIVKPISRASFVTSKFIAYFLMITIMFSSASILFYLYTVTLFETFDFSNFAMLASQVLIYLLLIVSSTIFASTIAKSNIVAGIIGFISAFLFGSIMGLFKDITPYAPGYFISNYKNMIERGWTGDFTMPTMISILLITLLICSSILIFRKQEIER